MASKDMTETEAMQFLSRTVANLTEVGALTVFNSVEDIKKGKLALGTLGHVKAADVLGRYLKRVGVSERPGQ